MSTSKTIHQYFRRKVSDWDIVRFLDEFTKIESYRHKIARYLSSLKLIVNTENGQRRKRALELQKLYREGSRPDKKRAKEWEKMHSYSRIYIHRSTINGTVKGVTNGVYGTMSGGVFDVKLAPKRSNQKEDNDEGSKRTKIDQYFCARAVTPPPLSQEKSKINADSLDCNDVEDSDCSDVEDSDCSDVEDSHSQELPPAETSKDTIIERLINSKSSIARYRIIFLPERNFYDPIKCLYVDKEWSMMESTWEKIEKKIVSSLPPIAENLESLLEKYNGAIIDATNGYYVDLNKVWITISKTPFADQHLYLFTRDWPLQWIQQIYTAFLKCFQTPFNPLYDADASEYAYRSRVINYLWEEILLDVNNIIRMKTGEVENVDRKNQLDLTRDIDKHKSCAGSWYHDAVLTMKVGNKDVQIAFGEVIGNAFRQDDKKLNDDREKILKAMRLALTNLRKLLPENVPGVEELETFGLLVYKKEFFMYSMHYVDGIYYVDQYDGFTIPDTPLQLGNVSDIARIMFTFKNRVIKLQRHVESLHKSKISFKRGGTLRADDLDILASIC